MYAPHDDAPEARILCLKNCQITYAGLVKAPPVVDNKDVACLGTLKGFEEYIYTPVMPRRQHSPCHPHGGTERSEARVRHPIAYSQS